MKRIEAIAQILVILLGSVLSILASWYTLTNMYQVSPTTAYVLTGLLVLVIVPIDVFTCYIFWKQAE